MKNHNVNKKDGKGGGMNKAGAALAGAVIGAGVAVAGVLLSDEKNRGKISKVVKEAKNSLDTTTKKVNKAVKSL